DANGINQLAGNTTIAANSQIAAFLDQAPFIPSGTTLNLATLRTFTFSSTVPVAVITLRGLVNERSEFLLTTLPVISIDNSSSSPLVFSHFSDGGEWKSKIILVNPTDAAITGTVTFYSQGTLTTPGAPTTLTANGTKSSSFSYTIAPRASYKLETA